MSSKFQRIENKDKSKINKIIRKSKAYYLILIIYILGNISEEKISDTSTFYSINTQYIEEEKITINTNQSNACKIFHYSSTNNFFKNKNSFNLNSEQGKNKKLLKIKDKQINHYCKINEIKKSHFVDKKTYIDIKSNKININNTSIPVNSFPNIKNGNKKDNINKQIINKMEISKKDGFIQNTNISRLKEIPPKLPDLFNYEYNLENKNAINNNSNEAIGQLNKGIIPISFYNHFMININNNKQSNNNKYYKSSITHRNKKKVITLIYYSPN